MTTALRQASLVLVSAARLPVTLFELYKELAVSASGLLRPETYRTR